MLPLDYLRFFHFAIGVWLQYILAVLVGVPDPFSMAFENRILKTNPDQGTVFGSIYLKDLAKMSKTSNNN